MKSLLFLFLLAVPALSTSVVRSGKPLATALAAYSSTKNDAKRVWWDRFGTASKDFICYEPSLPSNDWKVLGHRGQQNHDDLTYPILAFRPIDDTALASAQGFEFIWDDRYGTNLRDASLWRPSCPSGYVALGDVFYARNLIEVPGQDLFHKFRCVRSDLTERCNVGDKVWDDGGSTSWFDVSVWEPLPSERSIGGFLYGHNKHAHPPQITMYCLLKTSYGILYGI